MVSSSDKLKVYSQNPANVWRFFANFCILAAWYERNQFYKVI